MIAIFVIISILSLPEYVFVWLEAIFPGMEFKC